MEIMIETEIGIIHKWKDDSYAEKINQSLKRRDIESAAIKDKLLKLYPESILSHKDSGEPIIKGNKFPYISISHCKDIFTFYLAHEPIGIDIQYYVDSLLKGKHYFLNKYEDELEWTELDLLLLWSAKEAFYKKKGGAIGDLRDEVTVTSIDYEKNQIMIQYNGMEKGLNLQIESNFVMVWT